MKYIMIVSLLFLVSCIPSIKIISNYNSSEFSISELNGSSARLYVNQHVDILEFNKSFENEYKSEARFDSIFTNQLKVELDKLMMISISTADEIGNIFMDSSFSDAEVAKVKESFEKVNEKYFITIKMIVISNDLSYSAPNYIAPTIVSTPSGRMSVGGGFWGGGQSENCVVTIKAEVWSLKEKKKLSEFISIGKEGVTFFAYGTALKGAVKDAISNFSNYIEKNRTK